MKRVAVLVSVLCFLTCGIALQAKDNANSPAVVGTWNCVAHGGPNGDVAFTLYLQKSENGLSGSVSAPQGDADLTSVTFKDNHLKIDINTYDNDYALDATLADGKLNGTWYLNGTKQGDWTGKK